MRVCFVGDVVGGAGRRAFRTVMPGFLRNNSIDCCIVNAENSVHGLGASINILRDLEAAGADLFTMGNHTFSNRDFISQINKIKNVTSKVFKACMYYITLVLLFVDPFYLSILYFEDGEYLLTPTTSPENRYVDEEDKWRAFTKKAAMSQAIVKELQYYITENYYTCTKEILAGLGKMYTADERFKENIDKCGEGTAEFASAGIEIYCK